MSGYNNAIGWCDVTWNPIRGCSRVSEGCRHCYAEIVAARFSGPGLAYEGLARRQRVIEDSTGASATVARWTGEIRFVEDALTLPLSWKKPRRVFVNSMSDLFHEKVTDEWIDRIFAVMALAPQHQFQALTKRADRMRKYFDDSIANVSPTGFRCPRENHVLNVADRLSMANGWTTAREGLVASFGAKAWRWPPANVWLGVSVENQAAADERIPLLLQTPAAVRFLSVEPLLGPVNLDALLCRWRKAENLDVRIGGRHEWPSCEWVILGCESRGIRPGRNAEGYAEHARSLIEQCAAAGAPVYHKQMPIDGRVSHDPAEWPDWARVREFPPRVAVQEGDTA